MAFEIILLEEDAPQGPIANVDVWRDDQDQIVFGAPPASGSLIARSGRRIPMRYAQAVADAAPKKKKPAPSKARKPAANKARKGAADKE